MIHKALTSLAWMVVVCLMLAPAEARAASKRSRAAAQPTHKTGYSEDPYLGAIVVEAPTGQVLFEDHADAKGIPASLVKMMDLLLILEKVERGELSLQDKVPVSAKAESMPASNVGLRQKETFTVDELLYALMVHSANDAAVALAEKAAGSTEAFIELMNHKAKELGLTATVFHSVNGLPPAAGEAHSFTTARELSIIARELLKHKEALRYTATRERVFRPNAGKNTVRMVTHNHLLDRVPGCDGLKTGFIGASGFSITVTATRSGKRVVVVVLDSAEMKVRDAKAAELVEKGFAKLGVEPPAKAKVKKAG